MTIQNTQIGVQYSIQYREIVDHEFIHETGPQPGAGGIWHGLPQGLRPILLRRVADYYGWLIQSVEAVAGTGGDVVIEVSGIREDTWFFAVAEKTHQGPNGPYLGNSITLQRVPLVFTYPDTAVSFPLQEVTLAAGERLEIPLTTPQPGVLYQLVNLGDGNAAIGPQIYLHDTNPASPRRDGIGPMGLEFYSQYMPTPLGSKVGVDFVVGPPRDTEAMTLISAPLPAETPVLQVGVVAIKAQTQLSAPLNGTFTLNIQSSGGRSSASPAPKPRAPRKP